jgi:bifunctional NMN adenylyltransferase/nudix hydrolase
MKKHKKVLVLIGTSEVKGSKENPLGFVARAKMICASYPGAVCYDLKDKPSDSAWSKDVDSVIRRVTRKNGAILYGSRNSFIGQYCGKYKTKYVDRLDFIPGLSGTEQRAAVGKEEIGTADERKGAIKAALTKYPISYQTVDAVIVKYVDSLTELLLARKKTDPEGKWRFVGGFVGVADESLERAVLREASEETGEMELADPKYLGSIRVDDWRYKGQSDKIMTAVFKLTYCYGAPHADSDISELKWFNIKKLKKDVFVHEHKPIFEMVKSKLEEER